MDKKTVIKGATPPNKKNTIKFKGVTRKQIELLKTKKTSNHAKHIIKN